MSRPSLSQYLTALWPRSVSTRLMLAFALVAVMTLLAAGLAFRSSLLLEERLEQIREESIEVLYASARLNELSQQLTAYVPRLVSADSNYLRQRTREQLDQQLAEMQQWVIHLPDYNRYFIEISDQIRYSIGLIQQTVEERERQAWRSHQHRLELYPLYLQLNEDLDKQASQSLAEANALMPLRLRLNYLSALAEKLHTDSSFAELDYTFLRLEEQASGIHDQRNLYPAMIQSDASRETLERILLLTSREGELFDAKNRELDLRYQEEFLVANSQRHIQQLAAQISHYTERVNHHLDRDIEQAALSVSKASDATFMLSLISLLLAGSISWFYVRRNILGRLSRLQSNMRAIASGHLDIDVVLEGRDEITSMARDLRHFQLTAKASAEAHRSLARETEERLTTEKRLRMTQQELIQAGKLAALGQLSVAITHEINQPLAAMRNQVHSISRWLEKGEPERAEPGLERLARLLEKTAGITHHLRSFARKADHRRTPVMLKPIIQASVELCQTRSSHCRPTLIGPDDLSALAESIRLEQVLVNLLINALDAVQSIPQPRIEIHWQALEETEQVEVIISDNGTGIDSTLQEHIFDPYFTTKSQGSGLGLGLSISYNIMQDFGGSIRLLESSPGGTRFQLLLPITPASQASASSVRVNIHE